MHSCRGRQLGQDYIEEEAPADDEGDAADGRVVEAKSVEAGVFAAGGGLVQSGSKRAADKLSLNDGAAELVGGQVQVAPTGGNEPKQSSVGDQAE
jgi:hypothetical protein